MKLAASKLTKHGSAFSNSYLRCSVEQIQAGKQLLLGRFFHLERKGDGNVVDDVGGEVVVPLLAKFVRADGDSSEVGDERAVASEIEEQGEREKKEQDRKKIPRDDVCDKVVNETMQIRDHARVRCKSGGMNGAAVSHKGEVKF